MDWKELENVIEEGKGETNYVEAMELGGVVLPLIKLKKFELFLWGTGMGIDSILLYLKANDMNIKGIIYHDKKNHDSYSGIPLVTLEEIDKRVIKRMFVIITDPDSIYDDRFTSYSGIERYARKFWGMVRIRSLVLHIYKRKMLHKYKIQNYYFLRRTEFREICVVESSRYCNRMEYYKSHLKELKITYDMLCDDISRETMTEFIRVFLQNGHYSGKECDGRNKYFAGYGCGKNIELLYEHKEDEIWVNCGASVGDTILLYLSEGYKANKIYAFEGSIPIYNSLCRNINQLPDEMREIVNPVNIFISEKTNWDFVIKEKISLLNADVEGYELELLHTMKNRIKSDRPVLAICVYHHNEDLINIPQFIDKIVDRYKYFLRKYPSTVTNAMRTSELVLYAVPQERLHIKEK